MLDRRTWIAGLVLLVGLAACAKVPYTGRQALVLLPFDSEVQLGADAYKQILSSETVVAEGSQAKAVRSVGKRIARRTPRMYRGLDWEFKLLKSEDVNAFALPGGKVAVYEGILPILSNEGGLAAVMGHEVGHAVARHGAERISGTMLLELGLSVADVSLGSSEYHDQLMALMGLGAVVGVVLPFSRANELEADYLGGIFMAKAGYDPRESVAVWERMSDKFGDRGAAIFSTHPTNRKRIERLQEEMPTFQKYYDRAKTKRGRGEKL